jgi:hypothetical protein
LSILSKLKKTKIKDKYKYSKGREYDLNVEIK